MNAFVQIKKETEEKSFGKHYNSKIKKLTKLKHKK